MRVFRYMPRQYAEAAVQYGRMRLSTFESVKTLESLLADPFDGAFVRRDSLHHIEGELSLADQLRWKRMGVGMYGNNRDIRLNITNVSRSTGYMLCCTDRPDNDYLLRASPANDTVLEISDFERFVRELTRRDPVLRAIARQPVGPGRTRVIAGRVEYGVIEGNSFSNNEPHPLMKALRFAPEREIRAAWCSGHTETGPLDVQVPQIRNLLRIL